jgi:uncharacterized metal-binding protein
MPSGKTHDAITIILAAPIFAGAFVATGDVWLAGILTAGFLFGGVMFGPDLDTVSTQYSRWGIFRLLWFPYRSFFRHRSRWSHGLLFGTLLRVIYFMGVATCVGFLVTYMYASYAGGRLPRVWEFPKIWANLGEYSTSVSGRHGVIYLFVGMWVGAASHTLADLIGSYVKTGRVTEFL